jgi:RNA polymerase sigma-70 factor (ECF subfamily)
MSGPDQERRFLEALEAHKKLVYKVGWLYCVNPADRQELTQEILVQLWRAYPRFDGRSKLSTFVYRIALNVAISWCRDQRRPVRQTVRLDEAPFEPTVDDAAEDAALVQQLLGRLPELDRALMLLSLEGHDHDAIGEILGLSATNVGTRLGRIRQRLRDALTAA